MKKDRNAGKCRRFRKGTQGPSWPDEWQQLDRSENMPLAQQVRKARANTIGCIHCREVKPLWIRMRFFVISTGHKTSEEVHLCRECCPYLHEAWRLYVAKQVLDELDAPCQ